MKNHYDILGINRNATPDEIKIAYRKLSLKFHPDKNNGENFFADMFRQINEAYTVLYDLKSKKAYDLELFKFENPEPIVKKVYQQTQQPTPKSNYNNVYKYKSVDKWEPVKKWRQRRNIMLVVVLILILIIFIIPKNGQSQSGNVEQSDSTSNITIKAPTHHKRKHRSPGKENAYVTTIDSTQSNIAPEAHEAEKSKVTDTVIQVTPNPKISNDSVPKTPNKKRSFFGRIFGKKKHDTV